MNGSDITMVVSGDWTEPLSPSAPDKAAAQRRQEFQIGWFLDPIYYGQYPASMRQALGSRLPSFSSAQSHQLKGSADYLAINHYTSRFGAAPQSACPSLPSNGWDDDQCCVTSTASATGEPIGPQAGSDWLLAVPWGLRKLLVWLSERYQHPVIIVTENGCDDLDGPSAGLNDTFRIRYHQDYLAALKEAVLAGVDVRGYFVWSLLDNFEWGDGFSRRFGLYHVADLTGSLVRTPKASVEWFRGFISSWRLD